MLALYLPLGIGTLATGGRERSELLVHAQDY